MALEFPVPLPDPIGVALLVLDLLELLGVIPDPLSWLTGLFGGRPTMQATYDEAKIFMQYSSPVLRLLGTGAALALNAGIPLSDPAVGSLFGPYFQAARIVEDAIRWGDWNPDIEALDATTLSVAMTEAGNPGVAGNATLIAIQNAWDGLPRFPLKQLAVAQLQWWVGFGQYADMVRAIGTQYGLHLHPGGPAPKPPTPPGTPPPKPPGTPPPSPPPPPPVSGPFIIFANNSAGAPAHLATDVQSGTITFFCQVTGGPFPEAHVDYQVDNRAIGSVQDGNSDPAAYVDVAYQPFDTTTISDGDHIIAAQWVGVRGDVHATDSRSFMVRNGQPAPGPGPGPAPQPTPVPPWTDWFKVCAETPACEHMGDEALALMQAISNIAYAVYNLPKMLQTDQPDPCCIEIVTAITGVATQLASSLSLVTRQPNVALLLPALAATATALGNINTTLGGTTVDFTGLEGTIKQLLAPLNEIAAKVCCPDLSTINEQLTKFNADDQIPASWIDALVASGAVPPDMVQLLQGTTWKQAVATAANYIGWLFGWGSRFGIREIGHVFEGLVIPTARAIWQIFVEMLKSFDAASGLKASDFIHVATTLAGYVDEALFGIFGKPVGAVITLYEADIDKIDRTTEAGIDRAIETLMSRSFGFGMAAHALAILGEMPYFTKHLGLKEAAAMVAEFSGFKEVIIQAHRPFLTAALGRPATQVYNRKYPTTLPPANEAMVWHARRILHPDAAEHVAASFGFPPSWYPAMEAGAYKPISPFVLRTLYEDRPVDLAGLREVLEDNAYSPQHVQFMTDAIVYFSAQTVRKAYVSELEAAYQRGVMSEQEMHAALDDLGFSDVARKYIIDRSALARRITLANKVEAQVLPLLAAGNITPDQAAQQLEAAGIQPWYYQLEVALGETKAEIHATKLAATAEHRAELARQRNLTRAAIAEFHAGHTTLAGLTAALIALGLERTLVESIVALQDAYQHGRLKLAFGQLLLPADAELLAARVAALEQQFKDTLIDLPTAKHQLAALNVPDHEISALVARWSASLKKSPGAAMLVNPLTGAAGQ